MLATLAALASLACSAPIEPVRSEVNAEDLLMMRDLSGLSLSPDGSRIAFQVQQADMEADSYRSSWCVTDLASGRTQALGDGGDIIMPVLAGSNRRTGMWQTLAPRWAPDGRRFAALARRGDTVGILICDLSRRHCRDLPHGAGDIDDLVWGVDGDELIFQQRSSQVALNLALAREGDRGFHVDDRFDFFHALSPVRLADPPRPELLSIGLNAARARPASSEEISWFNQSRRAPLSTTMGASRATTLLSGAPTTRPRALAGRDVRDFIAFGAGGVAWTEPARAELAGAQPPLALNALPALGASALRCDASACEGRIVEIAAAPDESGIVFIRREGWGESRHGVYLWDVRTNTVRTLLVTDDVVRVCAPRIQDVICFLEGATQPRIVVAIDYATGALRTVFDPNPDLPQSAFLPARKLEWRSPMGDEIFGYLLAPERRGETPAPLIIVQYRASGFLRGGVGDEYPIQAFARRGFAVLVLERPDPFELRARLRDAAALDRQEWADLSERRRTLAALTSGIDQAVGLGVADRTRVGVTGLSDGAETAVFALIHCRCIAAAAISGGVHDPLSFYLTSDEGRASMRETGRGDAGALWPQLSLSLNADRVSAPILAQVADREALFMLQAQRTFADQGRPFDLYIFPDEYHVKWRPRHRAVIYRRGLQWFAFWLQDEEDDDPSDAEQYARWRAWRPSLPH
jgi:dipeptidyl aminopeptidase/acylaminoacyl peptidase